MHFDNAFLTASNKLGIQVIDKHSTITVYQNKKGQNIVSDIANKEQKKKALEIYERKQKQFPTPVKTLCKNHLNIPHCGMDVHDEHELSHKRFIDNMGL